MNFKLWLNEAEEKGYSFYANLLLNMLDLDKTTGLSTTISTFDKNDLIDKLNKSGEFKDLDENIQQEVIAKINSPKDGLLGDIVTIMSQTAESI